jgi:hypothetical protein
MTLFMDSRTVDGGVTAQDVATAHEADLAPQPVEVAPVEIEDVLTRTMERLVVQGTASEAWRLEAMSAATRTLCPGAAAALVDWRGTEVARLRAFGIVHGVVLRMPVAARRHLLADLLHRSGAPRASRARNPADLAPVG